MNKKVVVILVVIVIAMGAYFGYDYFFKGTGQENAKAAAATGIKDMYTYTLEEPFVTNIKESKALSKVSVALGLKGPDETEFLKKNEAVIRSSIVDVMRSHTEAELRADGATETISKEMVESINKAMQIEDIVNVYISDYVIQ